MTGWLLTHRRGLAESIRLATSLHIRDKFLLLTYLLIALAGPFSTASEPVKDAAIRRGGATPTPAAPFHRRTLTNGVVSVPVIVGRWTPYQMGWQLGPAQGSLEMRIGSWARRDSEMELRLAFSAEFFAGRLHLRVFGATGRTRPPEGSPSSRIEMDTSGTVRRSRAATSRKCRPSLIRNGNRFGDQVSRPSRRSHNSLPSR